MVGGGEVGFRVEFGRWHWRGGGLLVVVEGGGRGGEGCGVRCSVRREEAILIVWACCTGIC